MDFLRNLKDEEDFSREAVDSFLRSIEQKDYDEEEGESTENENGEEEEEGEAESVEVNDL